MFISNNIGRHHVIPLATVTRNISVGVPPHIDNAINVNTIPGIIVNSVTVLASDLPTNLTDRSVDTNTSGVHHTAALNGFPNIVHL
jgi:hypothetical protein